MRIIETKSNSNSRGNNGFSIVEALVCVLVIGILASIVVVNFATIDSTAHNSAHRSSAQQIATLCQEAQAVGLDFVVPNDLTQTIKNVAAGGSPKTGSLKCIKFGSLTLASDDIPEVSKYLSLKGAQLIYKSTDS